MMSVAAEQSVGTPEVREQVSLDGVWEIWFDPANEGVAERWVAGSGGSSGPQTNLIQVPSCWEEVRPGYDGVAWYRRSLEVSQAFKDAHDRFSLTFRAVNYYAQVWLNEALVGEHEGGYTPFSLDVTDHLVSGVNQLVVRVLDPPKDDIESVLSKNEAGIDGFVLKETPCWRELESFNFGGIWQPVSLVGLSRVQIRSCFVKPILSERAADVELEIVNTSPAEEELKLTLSIEPQTAPGLPIGEVSRSVTVEPGTKTVSVRVPTSGPVAWSPDNPFLYGCAVGVTDRGGRPYDFRTERFGFREFTMDRDGFRLNGQPVFIKGGFHEGLYPRTIAYPPSDELARQEILIAKEAGFNLLRIWQVPVHPAMLDAADELGMMICEEPPIEWIKDSPHLRRRCLTEVRELVTRDRNRPCVVMWGILNESSHLPDFPAGGLRLRDTGWGEGQKVEYWQGTILHHIKEELCLAARLLDPTRLVIDESGGWVGGANAYLPYETQPLGIEDLHIYRPAPTSAETVDYLRGLPPARGPVYVSEVGYGSIPDLEAVIDAYHRDGASREHGSEVAAQRSPTEELEDFKQYDKLRKSLDALLSSQDLRGRFPTSTAFAEATQELQAEGNRRQLQALRCNPGCTGYVLHAYSAGGVVLGAEVVDIWRRPKPAVVEMLKRVHRPVLLAIHTERSLGAAREPVHCRVTLVNEGERVEGARLEITLEPVDDATHAGQVEESGAPSIREVTAERGVQVLFEGQTAPPQRPGRHLIRARLWRYDVLLAEAEETYWAIRQPDLSSVARSVTVVDSGQAGQVGEVLAGTNRVGHAELASHLPTSRPGVVLIFNPDGGWSDDRVQAWGPSLVEWVAAGGTAILQGPFDEADAAGMSSVLPFEVRCRPSVGSWNPCVHYPTEHPIYEGLPADLLMGPAYAPVMPRHAFVGMDGDAFSGCLSMEATIFQKPEVFWWGATVLEKPHGKGRFVLSQLRIGSGLADGKALEKQLLSNTLRYATTIDSDRT